jgi:hypothetical protein
MKKPKSLLNAFAGDPAMDELREHAGWKPVLSTLLALAFCVSMFFSMPEPEPSRVAMKSQPHSEPVAP